MNRCRIVTAAVMAVGLASAPAHAALGDHVWSRSWSVSGVGSAVDGNGASSIAGTVSGSVDFGGGTLPGGSGDVFVAKYAPDGSHVWSGIYDATSFPTVTAVACAPAGDTYVAGVLSKGGTIDFGGGPIGGTFGEIWAVRFDPAGNHVWSDTFGRGVVYDVDASDAHVAFAARNNGIVNFGGGDLTMSGDTQAIVAVLAPDGSHEWSAAFGDGALQEGRDVVLLSSVQGSIDFGGGALSADADPDVTLAKFSAGGALQWSQIFAGQFAAFSSIQNTGMDVNSSGSIVMTGEFTGSVTFGGGTFVSDGLDVFVARFDGAGFHNYSAKFGGAGNQSGTVAWFDPSFNVMLAGTFAGDLDFGAGPLPSAGGNDVFVASIDGSGAVRFARSFGGTSGESRVEGAAGPGGECILSTVGFSSIDFGGGPLPASFFLAKLDGDEGVETAAPQAGGPRGTELAIYPNPFVAGTTIRFTAPGGGAGTARVRILDVAGREVRSFAAPGPAGGGWIVSWDGRSDRGAAVVSGVYFVQVETAETRRTERVVRLR
jgi:hypothetical protein